MNTTVGARVCLYGLDDDYNVIRYANIDPKWLGISEIIYQTINLVDRWCGVSMVWAIDYDKEVHEACRDSLKNRSLEDKVLFKLLLEGRGIRIV